MLHLELKVRGVLTNHIKGALVIQHNDDRLIDLQMFFTTYDHLHAQQWAQEVFHPE